MASLNPGDAGPSSPSPPKPDPLEIYLLGCIFDLVQHVDNLFSRYRAAGIKYHSIPWAVRTSTHLEDDVVYSLDEVFSLTSDRRLPSCVASPFNDLIYYTAGADRALKGGNKDLKAADVLVYYAGMFADELEKRMYATEAGLADVVAIRNSLTEQGLVQTPDPWADARFMCFEEWAEASVKWTKEMTEMADEISLKPSGGNL